MPIIITASYQVRPQTIDKCKRAIENLVEYVKVALTLHRSSEAAEKFVSVVYPSSIDPLEFKEYEDIANNLQL